jgi:DNA-binding transcriptional LysR family regulator
LGVRLFERSTRSVSLTSIGEQFYERSLPAVTELEGALAAIDEEKDRVTGTLRLSAPYSAGPFFLDDLIAQFATQFPEVNVELIYDDNKVDLISSGLDAAIRSNTLLAPDTHAVPVGPELTMTVVASLDYLDRKGTPSQPMEILDHDTIGYAFGHGDQHAPWVFEGSEGRYSLQPRPKIVANDMRSLLQYASSGLGLTYVYREIARSDIEEGKLIEVLKEHVPSMPRYSLNYLNKKNMTRRLRAFIDLAKTQSQLRSA